jgi:hypothetical protein
MHLRQARADCPPEQSFGLGILQTMGIDRFHPVDEPWADLNLGWLVLVGGIPGVGHCGFIAFACLKCLVLLENLIEVCIKVS